MDEAKKYLFEHRDELDVEKPPRPQVWKRIRQQTSVAPKPVISMILVKWLAAACVLALATFLIVRLQSPTGTVGPDTAGLSQSQVKDTQSVGQPDAAGMASIPVIKDSSGLPAIPRQKEHKTSGQQLAARRPKADKQAIADAQPLSPFEAMEDSYASIISYQLKRVEKTPIYTEDAGYFHVFKKQWFDLQKDERKVKNDLQLYGLNDNMVNQLIRLYQQKLKLLKELQSEINKMNSRARQHPGLQRNNPAYLKL